jgi:hypothetical protein
MRSRIVSSRPCDISVPKNASHASSTSSHAAPNAMVRTAVTMVGATSMPCRPDRGEATTPLRIAAPRSSGAAAARARDDRRGRRQHDEDGGIAPVGDEHDGDPGDEGDPEQIGCLGRHARFAGAKEPATGAIRGTRRRLNEGHANGPAPLGRAPLAGAEEVDVPLARARPKRFPQRVGCVKADSLPLASGQR